ncbi:MAG: non-canonical purine NTP pyrophosphatase [Asgard group archaeon]|nr:non-canonical purine NTP pyrophosphatase [Asgard group archaeon]
MINNQPITFVTKNKEKIADIKYMIGRFHDVEFTSDIDLIEIQSLSVEEVVAFKAKQAFDLLNKPVAVSDSGLEITSLNKFPGALVKFANEALGQEKIVKLLEDEINRQAFFVAAIAFYDGKNNVHVFVERDEGTIAFEPRGEGWHFDRIFILKGTTQTWAEIGRKDKNTHSAFRRALKKLEQFLEKNKK